jgi:hypothetical protein
MNVRDTGSDAKYRVEKQRIESTVASSSLLTG